MKIRHKLFDRVTVYTSEGELEISGTTVVDDHIGQILLSKNENLEEVTEESKEENIEKEPVTEVENEEKYKKGKDKK